MRRRRPRPSGSRVPARRTARIRCGRGGDHRRNQGSCATPPAGSPTRICSSRARTSGRARSRPGATGSWLPAHPRDLFRHGYAAGFRGHEIDGRLARREASVDFVLEPAVGQIAVSGVVPPIDFTSNGAAQLPARSSRSFRLRAITPTSRGRTRRELRPRRHAGTGTSPSPCTAPHTENRWIIDGVNTNTLKGRRNRAMSSEFVQEVEVKTDGYSAEYGRALKRRGQRRHEVRRQHVPRRRVPASTRTRPSPSRTSPRRTRARRTCGSPAITASTPESTSAATR
jgi:hypothetical protein